MLGRDTAAPRARFTRKRPTERRSAASGEGTLSAVYVEIDDKTGLATKIAPLRAGGRLAPTGPEAAPA